MPLFVSSTVRGLADQEGSITSTWNPVSGGTTTRVFRGTQDYIAATATQLQAQGYTTEVTQEGKGAIWELRATLAYDLVTFGGHEPEPEPIWEIDGHAIEQSILECTDRPLIANLSTNTKALIEYAIKNPSSSDPLTSDDEVAQAPNALTVYSLMRAGVEAKQIFATAIKRTITVSRAYSCTWTLDNVGKVLSKNKLVSLYGVPTNIATLMPAGDTQIQTDINNIDTFQGYLEGYPSIQTIANNKYQISQTWNYNKWSAGDNGLYDLVS